MPTAAKLVAAILFALLAWIASELAKPLFPEGSDLGRFSEWNALIGAVIGWFAAGGRARTTWANAVAYGITAAALTLGSALLIYSFLRMLRQSSRRVYEGPIEALLDVVRIMLGNLKFVADPVVLVTLILGGVVCGLVTEWVGRNYS